MQHTNELQERRESDGRKQRTHKPADCPSVWRWCSNGHVDNVCWLPRWAQDNKVRHEQRAYGERLQRQDNPNCCKPNPFRANNSVG